MLLTNDEAWSSFYVIMFFTYLQSLSLNKTL